MKKPITVLTILVVLLSLSFIFSSCGNYFSIKAVNNYKNGEAFTVFCFWAI